MVSVRTADLMRAVYQSRQDLKRSMRGLTRMKPAEALQRAVAVQAALQDRFGLDDAAAAFARYRREGAAEVGDGQIRTDERLLDALRAARKKLVDQRASGADPRALKQAADMRDKLWRSAVFQFEGVEEAEAAFATRFAPRAAE